MLKIGVIAIQGNVQEHVEAAERALAGRGTVVKIKHAGIVPSCDGVIIPGGESTTLCRLSWSEGIAQEIIDLAKSGKPIMGTCAGLILLASKGDDEVAKTKQRLLGLMDTTVDRNAFGRQVDSFESPLKIKGFDEPFNAVFIRAPAVISAGKGVKVLAKIDDKIVAAQQKNLLALAFHPELTDDLRLHKYFLQMIPGNKN